MMRKLSLLAAGFALLAGCSSVADGAAGQAPAAPATTPAATTPAAAPEPLPCDPAVIADDIGRPPSQVNLGRCLGDWAVMDNGGKYGDTDYLVRMVAGRWVSYTAFPSSICRSDAVRDGVPADWHSSFPNCAPRPKPSTVDLGLATPMSSPACDGSGIVILASAVDPANYARDVQRALDANPGASYLRTDRSCPSLSQADANGNPIYAVYQYAGRGPGEICRALGRAPAGSYAKVLDTTTDPSQSQVSC